jgi:hypothetical protein
MSDDDSNQPGTDRPSRFPIRHSSKTSNTGMASYQSVSRANWVGMRRTSEGMPTGEIECLECGELFLELFPRSTKEILVTATPDPELRQFVSDTQGYRHFTTECPNGDTLYYYFQW